MIWVYIIDNFVRYDECMGKLVDVGIYVIVDVNNLLYSINWYDLVLLYNVKYLQSVFVMIDEFVKYENILVFFLGNEVVNDVVNLMLVVRYVKVVMRDMRRYIGERGYWRVLVGYLVVDVGSNRRQQVDWMNCGSEDERLDFFVFVSCLSGCCGKGVVWLLM